MSNRDEAQLDGPHTRLFNKRHITSRSERSSQDLQECDEVLDLPRGKVVQKVLYGIIPPLCASRLGPKFALRNSRGSVRWPYWRTFIGPQSNRSRLLVAIYVEGRGPICQALREVSIICSGHTQTCIPA
jgi:hypothetical protein